MWFMLEQLLVDADVSPWSCRPSGVMVNPDGSRGMYEGSSPLIAMLMAGRSTGQYTTRDPDESMQLSWSINMLFWLVLKAYTHYTNHIHARDYQVIELLINNHESSIVTIQDRQKQADIRS